MPQHHITLPDAKLPTRPSAYAAAQTTRPGQSHGQVGGLDNCSNQCFVNSLPNKGISRLGNALSNSWRTSRLAWLPAGVDRFAAAGMAATWWEESFYELQTAASRGWTAVIDAWLTTAEAGQDDKNASQPGRPGSHPSSLPKLELAEPITQLADGAGPP